MDPLEVADLIDEFDIGPLIAENFPEPVQNQFGGFDAGTPVEVVLDPVAAHNLTGRDLDQVPEADRNSEIVQFYIKVRLFVADGGRAASVVNYRDRRYRVVTVRDFELQGEMFCAFGALEDVQAIP